jgi:RNase P subunit RPR2
VGKKKFCNKCKKLLPIEKFDFGKRDSKERLGSCRKCLDYQKFSYDKRKKDSCYSFSGTDCEIYC